MTGVGVTADRHQLSLGQIGELVEALLACPTVSNMVQREMIVALVREVLPSNIVGTIQRDPTARVDVTNIVRTCLHYQNAIEELIRAVCIYEGPSPARQHLEISAERILFVPRIISQDQYNELVRITGQTTWPVAVLGRAFRASAPASLPLPEYANPAELLASMLRALANAVRQSDRMVPIFAFVERLAVHSPTLKDDLQGWVDVGAEEWEIGDRISVLRSQIPAQSPANDPPSLMIMLTPMEFHPGRFTVRAWLWRAGEEPELLERDSSFDEADINETGHPLAEVPAIVDGLIERCFSVLVRFEQINLPDDLLIEFFLPLDLLGLDVEQWLIPNGLSAPVPLGSQHPVVVRLRERLHPPTWRHLWFAWEHRWQRFPTWSHRAASDAVYYDNSLLTVEERSLQDVITARAVLFLALTRPDPATADHEWSQNFRAALQAGVPIVLWSGPGAGSSRDAQQGIQELLTDVVLKDLPRSLLRTRRATVSVATGIGCPFKLLWDSHERLPFNPSQVDLRTPYR